MQGLQPRSFESPPADATMDSERNRPGSRNRSQIRPPLQSSISAAATTRRHAHSLSVGSYNSANRVGRRKSSNVPSGINRAAVIAAITAPSHSAQQPSRISPDSLRPELRMVSHLEHSFEPHESSAIDESYGSFNTFQTATPTKSRNRRASDGSVLIGENKRTAGRELRCDTCGKGYKHSSCLTKHLWEHTPEWQLTAKLLISKHQQVQLLEAASVLVAMNKEEPVGTTDETKESSDRSSVSLGHSGSSNPYNGLSSQETTPPPLADGQPIPSDDWTTRRLSVSTHLPKRYSYHGDFPVGSAPNVLSPIQDLSPGDPMRSLARQEGFGPVRGDDMAGLAAAVEMLSSNFQTPDLRGFSDGDEIPPVPPLPRQWVDHSSALAEPSAYRFEAGKVSHRQSFTRGASGQAQGLTKSDDDDYMMLGKMEE